MQQLTGYPPLIILNFSILTRAGANFLLKSQRINILNLVDQEAKYWLFYKFLTIEN